MKKLIILLISLFFIASCAVVKSSRIVGKCYLGYPYRQIMVFICMLSFMPIVRFYTDDNRDRYLVRGNKLYPIMKDGINELPLVKISKKQAKIELQDYPFYYNVKD